MPKIKDSINDKATKGANKATKASEVKVKPAKKSSEAAKAPKDKKSKDKKSPTAKSDKKALAWEAFACQFKAGKNSEDGFRAKVPGGWFVSVSRNKSTDTFFYPDPGHKWEGTSL